MPRKKSQKRIKFNISPHVIFDGTIARDTWPIGVCASYPEELLKNILAATIAQYMGNKSVDYVKKKYLQNWDSESVGLIEAEDMVTIRWLERECSNLRDVFLKNTYDEIEPIEAKLFCDFNFLRCIDTIISTLDMAAKGYLFEVVVLCRSVFETISWSYALAKHPNANSPFDFKPESSIRYLKEHFSFSGGYYGYLSGYSHWAKFSHLSYIKFEDNYSAVYKATGKNKWEAISNIKIMLLMLSISYVYIFEKIGTDNKHLDYVRLLLPKISNELKEWMRIFKDLDAPYISYGFIDILISAAKEFDAKIDNEKK